ncbi:M17 family peptidase N-terminal domain-containing protein [Mucilaginibacter sp. CAU 1740]|uniref:M17 family peptidase N-terminal domain-containing protein n=1 Tax=Mucilaginibacter sp. CAU 1740 TaxID=3140365 RepID=UPI00325AFEBD
MKTLFQNPLKMLRRTFKLSLVSMLLLCNLNTSLLAQDAKPQLTAVGTTAVLGKADGITIEGKVQSPSGQATPLQIVCIFEYEEGDLTSPQALPAAANGLLHVDEALKGLITDLRKSGKFLGHRLETMLLTPPNGSMPAQKLLLVGLGNRKDFTPDVMTDIGRLGMREALRLGVSSYSHASDLKDGGVDSPTAIVAVNVVKGALEAYETEQYLAGKKLTAHKPLVKVTLLAGQAFFTPSGDAIKTYLSTRN